MVKLDSWVTYSGVSSPPPDTPAGLKMSLVLIQPAAFLAKKRTPYEPAGRSVEALLPLIVSSPVHSVSEKENSAKTLLSETLRRFATANLCSRSRK